MKTTPRYNINGKPILAPTAMTINYTRQAKTADRSESGIYDDDRIQDGIDINLTFKARNWPECAYICSLLSNDQYFDFTYKDPKTSGYSTGKFYRGDLSVQILNDVEDETLSTFSITTHIVSKDGDKENFQ